MQADLASKVRQQSQQQQAESRGMAKGLEHWRSSSEGAKWQQDRARLPVLSIRHDLLTQLADCDVVVVSGDTGCGKTTQVLHPTPCVCHTLQKQLKDLGISWLCWIWQL